MTDPITRLNAALEGRYRIEREIGEGGMATVYLAEDIRHERKVALKVLKPELAAVVGAERFLAEIKTTANLQHPHILPLHDSGEADGFLYFVMPYIEGDTLRDKMDREKQLSVVEALKITEKVASALDYAHNHGVVHRDIKPGNILLSSTGEPTVADFGIALAVAQAGGGRVTETGLSVGTPHYMSPEQATGDRDVDPRTDVYALGCVLYEMLTGDPPHHGSTAQAVLAQILTADPISPTSKRISIPPNVDAAIRKALEKLPADRFTTAQEFGGTLANSAFRHGQEPGVIVSVGPWRTLSLTTTVAAVLFAVIAAWSLFRPEAPQPVSRQVLSTEGWAGLDVEVGRYAALAPQGSNMILPLEGQLGLKLRASAEVTPIPGTERARDVEYSPDGEWIAYAVGSEIFTRPLVGGSPIRLAEDAEGEPNRVTMAWLDDGTFLYERGDFQLIHISENGGDPLDEVETVGALIWMEGLPGGRGALAVNVPQELYTVDLLDLTTERILQQVVRAWYAPTGHLVYVRTDGAVFAVPFDLEALELTGGAIPILSGVRTTPNRADMHLAADGSLLYVEGPTITMGGVGERELVVVDLEGNEQVLPLAPRPIPGLGVGWSPDGESVVFVSDSQIYTYNVVLNTAPRQITFEGVNGYPVYSPDGDRVAFVSDREGTEGPDLFVKDLNDDSPPRSIITLEGAQFVQQWPMDTLIVFDHVLLGGERELSMVDVSDPENPEARPYLTSEADIRRISVSPDGELAAYRSDESGENEIYVRSFPEPGERTVVSRGGGSVPFWSPDGNTLYYATGPGRPMMAARLQRDPVPVVLSTDTLFTLSRPGSEPFPGSALHPDGDRFITAMLPTSVAASDADATQPERLILVQNFFEELRQVVPDN